MIACKQCQLPEALICPTQGLTFLPSTPAGANPNPTPTLLTHMLQQGVISVPAFTLFLIDPSNPVPLPGSKTPGKVKPPVVSSTC